MKDEAVREARREQTYRVANELYGSATSLVMLIEDGHKAKDEAWRLCKALEKMLNDKGNRNAYLAALPTIDAGKGE